MTIAAPQPLSPGAEMPTELVAGCVGLSTSEVMTTAHRPVSASVGNSFVIAEVTGEALTRAVPDIGRFREAARTYTAMGPNRLPLYLYAHDGARIRTRMFSPSRAPIEDPATGSAGHSAGRPAAVSHPGQRTPLRHRARRRDGPAEPCLLCTAHRADDGIRASVGGNCVPVLSGEVSL